MISLAAGLAYRKLRLTENDRLPTWSAPDAPSAIVILRRAWMTVVRGMLALTSLHAEDHIACLRVGLTWAHIVLVKIPSWRHSRRSLNSLPSPLRTPRWNIAKWEVWWCRIQSWDVWASAIPNGGIGWWKKNE